MSALLKGLMMIAGTIWFVIILLALIAFGAYMLWAIYYDVNKWLNDRARRKKYLEELMNAQ